MTDDNVYELDAHRSPEPVIAQEETPELAVLLKDDIALGYIGNTYEEDTTGWALNPDALEAFAVQLIHLAELVRKEQRALLVPEGAS